MKNFTKNFLTTFALIVSFLITSGQTCPSGLISYWRLEEEASPYSDQQSGHDATVGLSAPMQTDGKIGNGLSFDGVDNSLKISDDADFDWANGQSFAIEFWVKLNSISTTSNMVFIGRDENSGNLHWWIGANVNTSTLVWWLIDSDGDAQSLSGPSLSLGTWNHIIATYNASTGLRALYVNGAPANSATHLYGGGFDGDASIDVGHLNYNGTNLYFSNIGIDELALYSVALDATDASTHYSNGNSNMGICDGPVPNIISVPGNTAAAGQPYTYDVFATGSSTPSPILYAITSPSPVPGNMSINTVSGAFSYTPSSINDHNTIVISATNAQGSDTQTLQIYLAEAPVCPANLKHFYKFEGNSATYLDEEGNTDAEALNAPTRTSNGKFGSALIFDGVDDGINIPDVPDGFENIANDASFSLEYWLKTSATGGGNMVAMGRQGTFGDPDTSNLHMWTGVNKSSGAVYWVLIDAHGEASAVDGGIISAGSVNDGNWHYVVAVRDDISQTNKLYIDGVLAVESEPYDYTWEFGTHYGDPFNIGHLELQSGSPSFFFDGTLDEMAIYTRALSATEIANNYAGGGVEHCAPGNYAPLVTSTPVTAATEDSPYTYTMTADDIDDGDVVELSSVTLPAWLSFNTETGVLSGTPLNDHVGDNDVTLRASDGTSNVDHSFTIAVANTNDAPVITSGAPDTDAMEDTEYSYTFAASDVDVGDIVTLSAVQIPSWLTFTPATGVLVGTPDNGDVGEEDIILRATDGTVNVDLEYTLTINNYEDPPVITGHSSLSIDEDNDIVLSMDDITATDPDTDPADLSLEVRAGSNYTFSGLTVTPAANFNGTLTVVIVVNDLSSESDPYDLPITVNPINDAPEITSTPVTTATEDALYTYGFEAHDVDGDVLEFTGFVIPNWLTLVVNSQTDVTLAGTPDDANIGNNSVTIRVSDGTVNVDQEFVIVVENINDAPVITDQNTIRTEEETPKEITVYDLIIDDPDNQVTDMTLTILPGSQYTFEGTTITPNPGVSGNITVNVKVNDGLLDSPVYALTVIVGPNAINPVLVNNLVRLYPNPVREVLNIQINTENETKMEIRSIAGNIVAQELIPAGTQNLELPADDFNNGLYILRIAEDNKVQVIKFTVSK